MFHMEEKEDKEIYFTPNKERNQMIEEGTIQEIQMSADEYKERMNLVMDKLDDDATPDKIKVEILNFLHKGDDMPCKKCNSWFDDLLKLTKEIDKDYE